MRRGSRWRRRRRSRWRDLMIVLIVFITTNPTYDLPEMRLMTIGGNVGYYSSGLKQVSVLGTNTQHCSVWG